MSTLEEVAQLSRQLAHVLGERDAWLAAGRQERYKEACLMVQALEVQLATLVRRAAGDRLASGPGGPMGP